jgi:rubrerythrin
VGGRSRAAAQLLSGQGFQEVYNLAGGIKAWQSGPGGVAAGPPDAGMELITGREKSAEMLEIAYGMEEGMRSVYEHLSRRVSDQEASQLFGTLAELEVHHKERILDLYKEHRGEADRARAMDGRASSETAEGAVTVQEAVEALKPSQSSVVEVLSFAMMLETQALDLYLRYWKRSEDPATRAALLELVDQEKSHLGYLGALLEKKAGGS